ncbi:MAG: nicotinate-nucleotide diphosphorylase (carboxylating), partial [Chloroflexi bacterium]|nr:nicotinate-nucleotide diphosphorylase (carboxylating) [Chloroflexota bacterium]
LAIEIECNTSEQVSEAIEGCPDIIMLDNMPLEEMKKAIDLIPDEIEVEASGNITLENVKDVALSGVNSISVGAITHSALALDFSLKFV